MWVLFANVATGTTLDVPAVYPTIGDAMEVAVGGDTIRLGPGVYTEHIEVSGFELTFEGQGATWLVAGGQTSLKCFDGASCTVRDIAFDGNNGSRSLYAVGANLFVDSCSFVGGVDWAGGAIYSENSTRLEVTNSTFDGNTVFESGGHIRTSGTLVVEVRSSTFKNGSAEVDGGAIRTSLALSVQLEDLWFEANEAGNDGGVFDIDQTAYVEMRRSLLCDNHTVESGGAALVRDAVFVAVGNIFLSNTADIDGGAITSFDGTLITQNNTFYDNDAGDRGAAVHATSGHQSNNDLYAFNTSSVAHDDPEGLLTFGAFWANPAGDTTTPVSALMVDPLLAAAPPMGCEPLLLQPMPGSPLIDAGDPQVIDLDGSGSDIGAYGGQDPYLDGAAAELDQDEDGYRIVDGDCDDLDPARSPGTLEVPADEIDQDCDGGDTCFEDVDLDGLGGPAVVLSDDLQCVDPGEADNADDPCVLDNPDDTDLDGVCDSDDLCPGLDDAGDDCLGVEPILPEDQDGDGIPDAFDPQPGSAGNDGVARAPDPDFGCGCSVSQVTPWPAMLLLLVAASGCRRRR